MEEAFARGQRACLGQQRIGGGHRRARTFDRSSRQHHQQVALRGQEFQQGQALGFVAELRELLCRIDRPPGQQPAHRAPEIEQGMQGGHLGIGVGRQFLRQLRLGDIDIGEVGHLGQAARGAFEPGQFSLLEHHAQRLHATLHRVQPLTVQGVAATQVVVEKTQGRTHREGVQPQRGLGQLDGHRVLIDAEDRLLQDHAAHDMAVVELRIGDGPAMLARGAADRAADIGDA